MPPAAPALEAAPHTPRLAPLDRPPTLLARLLYRAMRRRLGKVITPARTVYARLPALYPLAAHLAWTEQRALSLDPELRFLVKHYVAALNGCTFCTDLAEAVARQSGLPTEKVEACFDFRHSPRFAPHERAALAYVEEATRARRVSDATFAALRTHFDERAIVEITWLCALEHYYNVLNVSLGIGSDGLCALAPRPA